MAYHKDVSGLRADHPLRRGFVVFNPRGPASSTKPSTPAPQDASTTSQATTGASGPHDFERECGRILGLEPNHAQFQPNDDGGGRTGVTWKSRVQGHISFIALNDYGKQFGARPSWIHACHPHHQHLLLQTALAWKRELPRDRPEAAAPPEGRERDYEIHRPPAALVTRWREGATLAEALPQLAERTEFRGLLEKAFGAERTSRMFVMMQDGQFLGDDGVDLHEFLVDGIGNDAVTVWTAESPGREDDFFPIEIQEFHGIFQVWAPEFGHTGPFLSLDEAVSFVLGNWDDVRNGKAVRKRNTRRGK